MQITESLIKDFYQEQFGKEPQHVIKAPGRVNLIGEHTDYNDGFVMPLAIDRAIWIAMETTGHEKTTSLTSYDYKDTQTFQLASFKKNKGWIEYVKGVAWALQEEGCQLRGFSGVMAGDVPRGAGLSSSAALEVVTAKAFSLASDFPFKAKEMALLSQKAENKWIGVNCGIMDQMISAIGKKGHAMLLDCRSLETELVPIPEGLAVVILDTGTRRGLAGSEYNARRDACEKAAEIFGVKALRDVTLQQFQARENELDDLCRRRARHVISENTRTLEAKEAMLAGDAKRLGQLMNESHESLKIDYEVSCQTLDQMVEAARSHDACLGARMTGAGFGGCAVAIVPTDAAADFAKQTEEKYSQVAKDKPSVYVCQASDGAGNL